MIASLLPATWQLPAAIRNRLGKCVGRQRPMAAEGHLLLVLHAPPKPEEAERTGGSSGATRRASGCPRIWGRASAALAVHIDEYEDAIARLDRKEAKATTVDEYFQVLEQLTPIHRSVRNLYDVLQEARQLCPE